MAPEDTPIDPGDLDEKQSAIYEAGYVRGQDAMANSLRQWLRQQVGDDDG